MIDSDGKICTILNHYRCDHKDSLEEGQPEIEWSDLWSCGCSDRCPVCNHEIEPYKSEDLEEDES